MRVVHSILNGNDVIVGDNVQKFETALMAA